MARTSWPPGRPARIVADCFQCRWREGSHWGPLHQEDIRLLNRSKSCALYDAGQFVYSQGDACDGVYTIMTGTVAMRKYDPQGNSVLVRLRHAGETLGYRDYFAGEEYTTSAEALAPSNICFIRREAVRSLVEGNPTLGMMLLKQVAHDLQLAEETILQSAALPVRTRLAHLLLSLKERYGDVGDDGRLRIELPLSRQNIAESLGTRPETVTRTIHALEVDGVARFSGRTVVVPDLDRLLDEIDGE